MSSYYFDTVFFLRKCHVIESYKGNRSSLRAFITAVLTRKWVVSFMLRSYHLRRDPGTIGRRKVEPQNWSESDGKEKNKHLSLTGTETS
jgi:hypothetical protein